MKELIKKLKVVYNESTLGDIPNIIEELRNITAVIEQKLNYDLEDIEGYHLDRVNGELEDDAQDTLCKTAQDVIDEVDNWEFSPEMDLAYLMGRVSALKAVRDLINY